MPDPRAVVVTGSESTGKTALAGQLARALGAPWSPEYARIYVDARHAAGVTDTLGAADVEPIARGQIDVEDAARAEAAARGAPLVMHDTDLVSTVVYARHYYGACPPWILDAARARRGALYLLCAPDVDWIADHIRDRPAARATLHDEFRAALTSLGCQIVDVHGDWATRDAIAFAAVEALLGA